MKMKMVFKFLCILFMIEWLQMVIFVEGQTKSCFPCEDPRRTRNMDECFKSKDDKRVEISGLCAKSCARPAESCSHQIGRNGSECQFYYHQSEGQGCPADAVRDWQILQCNEQSGICECPPPASGHVSLEDDVVITSYPYQCCAISNQFATAPDILITNSGWRKLAFIANSSETWRCGLFSLTEDASGQRLRYDCPKYKPMLEGKPVSLQICAGEHTVTYRFRLPRFNNTSYAGRSVLSWEPLIAVHTHRSDKLVYSVQRSPPALNISAYDVRLVNCETLDCISYRDIPDTDRRVKESPSKSDRFPGVFRVELDVPEEAGKIALLVKPRGGRETVSAILLHRGKNTAQMAIFASVLALFLVFFIAAFVWFKKFYKPTPPAEVDVLVLYNSNAGLARHVARQLETHCMVKTKLDVVDIPRASAGMDPVEWLSSELKECQTVLILVFPENTAPPIYPRLYPTALHHLRMDAGRTRVVIGHAGGSECAPLPPVPGARQYRLPSELNSLVRAVRGAPWPGRGYMDARELARRQAVSEGGRSLVAMLEHPTEMPPPEIAPLPVDDNVPVPVQPPLPKAPKRDENKLAPKIPSTDQLLDPLAPNGNGRPPMNGDLERDAGIVWGLGK